MTPSDEDQLDRHLNAVVRGNPDSTTAIDLDLVLVVERVHAFSDARVGPRLSEDEARQMWADLLRQHMARTSPGSQHEPIPVDGSSET